MAAVLFDRINLSQPRQSAVIPWPAGVQSLTISLDDAEWNQTGTVIEIRVALSWDGGVTFPVDSTDTFVAGAKTRTGESPWSNVGPWTSYDDQGQPVPNPPTHLQAFLRKVSGTGNPRIGVRVGFDGDRTSPVG